jgi:branched-chain amino acid transport system permease protein
LLDLIVKAVAYSSCIGIGAAAIALIYNATKTFNFAHASLVSWGMYVMFAGTYLLGYTPYLYIPFTILVGAALGLVIYGGVNRWLLKAKASETNLMMSTLGADLVLFGFLNIYSDYLLQTYKIPAKYFVLEVKDVVFKIGDVNIRLIGIVAPLMLIIIVILLHMFLTKTKIGIAMRASIENPDLASISGVNNDLIYVLAWLIGGGLAALSGGLLSLVVTGYTAAGMTMIVSFFAGAIVGGLYSIFGSLLGGLLVGLSEFLGITLLASIAGGWIYAYRPAIPLAALAITLLLKPEGLAGFFVKVRE